MKKILILLGLVLNLFAQDIMLYENSYEVLHVEKNIKEISVGNKSILNLSLFNSNKSLKLFGKATGTTSILLFYTDNSHEIHQVHVNQNLKPLVAMIKKIEPNVTIQKLGNGTVAIDGEFKSEKVKTRVYAFLQSAGLDTTKIIDMTTTSRVHKMIRTKLYLVEINNQRAEDLGGITGLGFKSDKVNIGINNNADNAATFSGFLLGQFGQPTDVKGKSVTGTLNFLESKGVAKILDDTVLITTEDKNATFHVGGEVYIPTGITHNDNGMPTIQLEEKQYGLKLVLNTAFMNNEKFMNMRVKIEDSEFDSNEEHNVKLGEFTEVPSFISKNITTEVVAKSGQVIALGGRLHTEDFVNREKVPFLGDIPVLGEAFKHKKEGTRSNDLLFFLIPEIVDPNDKLDERNFYREMKDTNDVLHQKLINLKQPELTIEVEDIPKAVVKVEEPVFQEQVVEKEEVVEEAKIHERYQINIGKVFLRSVPKYGKVQAVWLEGHEFVAQSFFVEDETYLKIKEDCFQGECIKVDNPMWISEKFIKKVI